MTTAPTTRSRPALAVLLAIGGLVALTACADESAHPPQADVGPISCEAQASGAVRAEGAVTNHSSKSSTYVIDVEFFVEGASLDTRTAVVEALAPGSTASLTTTFPDAPTGAVACVVRSVERFKD